MHIIYFLSIFWALMSFLLTWGLVSWFNLQKNIFWGVFWFFLDSWLEFPTKNLFFGKFPTTKVWNKIKLSSLHLTSFCKFKFKIFSLCSKSPLLTHIFSTGEWQLFALLALLTFGKFSTRFASFGFDSIRFAASFFAASPATSYFWGTVVGMELERSWSGGKGMPVVG